MLSAGPTPRIATALDVHAEGRPAAGQALELGRIQRAAADRRHPRHPLRHQVVKFDTGWAACWSTTSSPMPASSRRPPSSLAHSFDGYSTNVPVADLVGGKAMVAVSYEGKPITADHGGPARLLVPHLYFWKSAKWVNGLQFTETRRARLLGAARLPHLRRPLARAALHR